jgi:hypothetical protein
MVRILFLLIPIFFSVVKVATAQPQKTELLSCDRLSNSLATTSTPQLNNSSNHSTIREEPTKTEPKIALAGFAIPSLWWAKEQFDPFGGKLIHNWLTNTQIKQIDLTVNWQLWTLLDYLGRYRFINQFGTVARQYGYSLRIFNQQQQCLALYEYNNAVNPPKWEIKIEGVGQESLPVQPTNNNNNK